MYICTVHCTIENDKLMVKYRADVQYWTYTCHTMENDNMHLEAKSGISENRFYWEDVFIFEEDKKAMLNQSSFSLFTVNLHVLNYCAV